MIKDNNSVKGIKVQQIMILILLYDKIISQIYLNIVNIILIR